MVKLSTPLVLAVTLFSSLAMANEDSKDAFAETKAAFFAEFQQSKKQAFDEFKASKTAYRASFNAFKKELKQTWDKPEITNKTTWVEYSKDNKTKRAVNFETGDIIVEVVGNNLTQAQIDAKVDKQLKALKQETTAQAFKKDRVINSKQPDKLIASQKMLPDVNVKQLHSTAKKTTIKQKNGLNVTRVTMKYPPKNVAKKGMVYLPDVIEKSDKWSVKPDLILAIMHTESHFNPMAQSSIPAYGLMQVVPTSAGKDVTKRYQGEAKLLPPEVLFNPSFNIEVGTSYINILMAHYLKKVDNLESRTYLAIAAYNGGIGAVARHFTGKKSLDKLAEKANTLTPEFIYSSLVNDFPYKETRNYLKKVHTKQLFYKDMLVVNDI